MSKPVNKTVVGAFVVGAFLLLFVMIMLLGGNDLFQKREKYVIYFDGSVKGLTVGSPVKFRGVDIGQVTDIKVVINPKNFGFLVPVYFEVIPKQLVWLSDGAEKTDPEEVDDREFIQLLIDKKGLKGQLQLQSMITGSLFINLDFYPETPITLVGADKTYLEIPSKPTTLEVISEIVGKLINKFKDLPIDKLVENLSATSQNINTLVSSQETRDAIANLNKALVDIQKLSQSTKVLVSNLDDQIEPVTTDLQGALASAQQTFNRAQQTFVSAEQTLNSIDSGLGERAPLRRELLTALNNVAEAARSISVLADYLQQHPEALLSGKVNMEKAK